MANRKKALPHDEAERVLSLLEEYCRIRTQGEVASLLSTSQGYINDLLHGRSKPGELIALRLKTMDIRQEIVKPKKEPRQPRKPKEKYWERLCQPKPAHERVLIAPQGEAPEVPILEKEVKLMAACQRVEVARQSRAREALGLPPIKIKVVQCIVCGRRFESAGRNVCGKCSNSDTPIPTLSGYDVIF